MNKNIIIDNLIVSYYSLGKGKITLLYLHGWKSHKELFLDVAKLLENKYQIVLLDLPGFGVSQIPGVAWDLQDYANFVNKFIEKLNLNNVVVIGHSMGGRIFPLLNFNKNVIGFVGTGPAGLPQKKNLKMKTAAVINNTHLKIIKSLIPEFFKDTIRSKDYKESSGFHKETIKKLLSKDMTQDIKQINKPTLLIWGEDDDQSPIWMAYKWKEYVKNSQLEIIKNCGHFPERDYPEITAKFIDNFIGQIIT